jgi:hypothetical protein
MKTIPMYRKLVWSAAVALALFSGCEKVKPLPDAPPFEYTFGESSNEVAGTLIESTNSDDILLIGGSKDADKGDYDLYLVRIDANGNKVSSRKVGEKGSDEIGYRAIRTTAGEFLIFGTKAQSGQFKTAEIQFTYLNDDFEVLRQTTTPTTLVNTGLYPHNALFTQTSDGGFFVGFADNEHPHTMRFNANGVMIDEETFNDYYVTDNTQMIATRPDGGYAIAVGNTNNYSSYSLVEIVMLDQFGNYESIKSLPTYFSYARPMAIAPFGTDKYALSIYVYSDSGSHAVVMLDSNFDADWTTVTNDQPYYNHIGKSSQGRILLSGDESTGYGSYGTQNLHVMIYDSTGIFSRSASFGGPQSEVLRAAVPISSGRTVLFGETQSYGEGGTDFYVIYYQE